MSNIPYAISSAADRLDKAGVPEARREAASLLRYSIDRDAAFLIAHPEYELTATELEKFENFVRRRELREPFQLIVGRQEFYGLDFEVQAGVLIPRQDTEILVEKAVEILAGMASPSFLEIGIGSGCISVSLLKAHGTATATAVDISQQALALAARNAERHGVSNRLKLLYSDLFNSLGRQQFDMVVSNPPYIKSGDEEGLQTEVVKYDPPAGLFAGEDGLDMIKRIAADAPHFLSAGGYLLMEIGHGQAQRVKELFQTGPWESVEFLKDLQRIQRTVVAQKAS